MTPTRLRRKLRGLVGPYPCRYDGHYYYGPREHYRTCREVFSESRWRAARAAWAAYYTNWNEDSR